MAGENFQLLLDAIAALLDDGRIAQYQSNKTSASTFSRRRSAKRGSWRGLRKRTPSTAYRLVKENAILWGRDARGTTLFALDSDRHLVDATPVQRRLLALREHLFSQATNPHLVAFVDLAVDLLTRRDRERAVSLLVDALAALARVPGAPARDDAVSRQGS